MNKIQKYLYDHYQIKISDKINDVATNLDGATNAQIIFYRLNKNGEDAFKKRLEGSNPGLLILNNSPKFNPGCPYLIVDEYKFEVSQKDVVDIFFPISAETKIVGVTGTNGKTSVCYFGMQIANLLNIKSISIGTVGVYGKSGKLKSEHRTTTPSMIEFRKILFNHNPEVVFVEMSSHALEQERLGSLLLDAAAWTNFTQDHLDYHHDMESYFSSKLKITKIIKDNNPLMVNDTEQFLIEKLNELNVQFEKVENLRLKSQNIIFDLSFNLKNLSLAYSLLSKVMPGFSFSDVDTDLIFAPPGRFDVLKIGDNSFGVVDYAHTPDAVRQVIDGVKNSFRDYKIITIVGCGGNRDKAKRPIMGKVACEMSDYVIFTSDNPRDEKPSQILLDITESLSFKNFEIEAKRDIAIKKGVDLISAKTILLILGKGHENYQEINGVKHDFDDKEILGKSVEAKYAINS